MKQISDIPIDVVRLVFEIAAMSDLSTACTLSSVSQEVQSWSDRFLFRHIVINDTTSLDDAMDRFIASFISDSPTPRIRRARSYVRSFSTKRYDDDDSQIPNFVRHCSALESLCLWSLEPPQSLFTLKVPSLRRLSFPYPNHGLLSHNMSFFCAVTHLELDAVSDLTIWDAGTGVLSMPSLTHLVAVMTLSIGSDMASVIFTVSARIPPRLEVLLLLLRRAQKNTLEGVAYDDRIILGVLPRLDGIEDPPDAASDDVFEDEWNQWSEQCRKRTLAGVALRE